MKLRNFHHCQLFQKNKDSFFLGRVFFLMIWILLFGWTEKGNTQKVTVSNDINIRENFAYDIFPDVKGNILFFHDRGQKHLFEIFDSELKYRSSKEIELPAKNTKIVSVLKADTVINIFYQWKKDNIFYIGTCHYDEYGSPLDTIRPFYIQESLTSPSVRFVASKDKKLVVFFWIESKNLHYIVLSNNTSKDIITTGKVESKEFNFRSDFLSIVLSGDGKIFLIGQKERTWGKSSDEKIMVLKINGNQYGLVHVFSKDFEISQISGEYDDLNQKLSLAGLLSKNGGESAIGYFVHSLSDNQNFGDAEVHSQLFSIEFMNEVYGKKNTKIKSISDVFLSHHVLRNDGGTLLILEIRKEYLRRAGSLAMGRFGDVYSGRGLIDYYNEDMIVINNHADGSEFWKKVLYKKQFSQDDNAIYSSYFLYTTPSRIKLVYNDEIKTNNTVSEYVLDPMGNFERKSVLSTQYQNLKLRFRDAIQISPDEIIIPSESTNKINLVKINYLSSEQ
jgi:hypothetical protein